MIQNQKIIFKLPDSCKRWNHKTYSCLNNVSQLTQWTTGIVAPNSSCGANQNCLKITLATFCHTLDQKWRTVSNSWLNIFQDRCSLRETTQNTDACHTCYARARDPRSPGQRTDNRIYLWSVECQALGIQSEKAPSIDIFCLQHLVVEGLLNFGYNAPSSGRFYKLANPVDDRD